MSRDEHTLDADRQTTWRRRDVLGILIVAIVVAEVSKDVIFLTDRGDWLPACQFLWCGIIACLPFLLVRMSPKAAGFDTRWLPSSRWHWVWFLGMVVLMFFSNRLAYALTTTIVGRISLGPFIGPVTAKGIIFSGIVSVLILPVAEEIFFRGYLLEQLRKLTRSGNALLIHSLVFGLFHTYARGLFTSLALFSLVNTFLIGIILGAWRIKFKSLLPLVIAHGLFNAAATIPLVKARYDEVTRRSHPICHTISEETTHITEPLRKDGSVDYVGALNQRFSQGVTPENNAAVLFWKAMGPVEIAPEYRDKYFRMLGIPPLLEQGDYFVDLDNTSDQLDLAMTRPWSRTDFPVLAEWLVANEKPLALVVEASKRPRRYDPLCCGQKTPLMAVLFPANQHYRDITQTLRARAMLQLNQGKLEEAWEDLLACHRLARLAGQSPTMVEAFVASSIEETACAGDQALLQHAHLTAPQVAKMREDLNRLPAMPKMAERLDVAERFTYLDTVSDFSRQGPSSLAGFGYGLELDELEKTINLLIYYGSDTPIDWDLALRQGNSWFDRIADAYREPTRAGQRKALGKIDDDIHRLKTTAHDPESLKKLMLDNPRQALSERLSQVLLTILPTYLSHYIQVEDRWIMRFELNKLGFTLASYRADHGAYPATLTDLVPNYAAEVPKDVFNDSELQYRLEGKGYLLYSVGINGKDDAAKSYDDRNEDEDEDWDDLVVRVPAPTMENKKR